jgi:HSP20 family protein
MNALSLFSNNTHTDIFDRLFGFDDIWTRPLVKEIKDYHNPVVKDLEDRYEISLIAPGLEKKDFNITLEGNRITISYDASDNKESYAYATKYSKSYTTPPDCDIENISALYKNGVMVVSLPKAESAKPRAIKVK